MKAPILCPKCREPLVNTTLQLRNGSEAWKKVCDKRIDHHFVCTSKESDNSIILLGATVNDDKSLKVFWNFPRFQLVVHRSESVVPFPSDHYLEIPWFEPDLTKYDELIRKIKKYILFS